MGRKLQPIKFGDFKANFSSPRRDVSGSPGTTELRKNSNATANAFVTLTYSYDMESEFLRSFFPSRARRCHFCMGISHKSRDLDRLFD